MITNLIELRKTVNVGVSAEFLQELPPISSKMAQILFLPLALNVRYSQSGNESQFYVDKLEFADILGLPQSYKSEGNLNKWVGREANALLSLEVCGIKIIKSLSLPRGEIVIEYSSAAINRFFQDLPRKGRYFTISGDTLSKMKNDHTWQLVKNLLSSYNYSNDTVCTFSRNTMGIKMIFGFEKSDYMRKNGHFARDSFEKNVLTPVVNDIRTMEQIQLLPAENDRYWSKTHERDYIPGRRALVNNYFLRYRIKKITSDTECESISEILQPRAFQLNMVELEDDTDDDIWEDVINFGKVDNGGSYVKF